MVQQIGLANWWQQMLNNMEDVIKNKVWDVVQEAINSETGFAFWRGKMNETDEFEWKILAEKMDSDDRVLIKVIKR